jgi:hypothetical protein
MHMGRQVDNMKFRLFGRQDEPEERHDEAKCPIAASEVEIVPGKASDELNLALYEHVTLESDSIDGGAYADALIPLAGNVADAAGQWNHAVVRFPEGTGWNDLLNRKTPGWEEWKQLGVLKDGKFRPQAAIKQAKLQPVAVANLALQGAAIVVGQAYMAEISKELEGIQSSISAIQEEMRMERESDVEASFELLREYLTLYPQISDNTERRQAIHGAIEGIRKDALAAWGFELKAMHSLDDRLSTPRRMKNDVVSKSISEFRARERDAQAAFQLFVAAEQASMQYDGDFSEERIAFERGRLEKALGEYSEVRGSIQETLSKRIEKISGNLLEIPDAVEDGYEPQNPLLDAAHFVGQNAPRLWIPAMRDEAEQRLGSKKKRWSEVAMASDPIAPVGESRESRLDQMDFIYNRADTIVVNENGVHFIRMRPDAETDLEVGDDDIAGKSGETS